MRLQQILSYLTQLSNPVKDYEKAQIKIRFTDDTGTAIINGICNIR